MGGGVEDAVMGGDSWRGWGSGYGSERVFRGGPACRVCQLAGQGRTEVTQRSHHTWVCKVAQGHPHPPPPTRVGEPMERLRHQHRVIGRVWDGQLVRGCGDEGHGGQGAPAVAEPTQRHHLSIAHPAAHVPPRTSVIFLNCSVKSSLHTIVWGTTFNTCNVTPSWREESSMLAPWQVR